MFAYCGNCPVNNLDPTGHFVEIWEWIPDEKGKGEEESIDHIIYDQVSSETKNIRYGTSTIGDSGCGVVAVFNALMLLGKKANLYDIRDYFEKRFFLRRFGTSQGEIRAYLKYRGIDFEKGEDASIIEKTKKGGVAIVTFWNEMKTTYVINAAAPYSLPVKTVAPNIWSGAHTVAITYSDGMYWVYNAFNNERDPYTGAFSFGGYNAYLEGGFISGCYIP